jgi:hypothetical protein
MPARAREPRTQARPAPNLSADGRVMLRSATEGPRGFRAPLHSIRESAREKPLLHMRLDRRHEPKNRAEHPTRSSNCEWPQHAQSGRLLQTEETSLRNFATPAPVVPHSRQGGHSLIARTRRPDITALQACSMRSQYDVYQPKDDAEGEHLEFKCHCFPDPIARVRMPYSHGIARPRGLLLRTERKSIRGDQLRPAATRNPVRGEERHPLPSVGNSPATRGHAMAKNTICLWYDKTPRLLPGSTQRPFPTARWAPSTARPVTSHPARRATC